MTPFHVFCKSAPNEVDDPKFAEPPMRKKGAPNSFESCAQPGCHLRIDAARNLSVTSQTKNVAGIKAVDSTATAWLRIGAARKTSGHLRGCKINRLSPASPSLRASLTINFISLGGSRTKAKSNTMVSARNVWR